MDAERRKEILESSAMKYEIEDDEGEQIQIHNPLIVIDLTEKAVREESLINPPILDDLPTMKIAESIVSGMETEARIREDEEARLNAKFKAALETALPCQLFNIRKHWCDTGRKSLLNKYPCPNCHKRQEILKEVGIE